LRQPVVEGGKQYHGGVAVLLVKEEEEGMVLRLVEGKQRGVAVLLLRLGVS
jgi:hypothetical protein